MVSYSELQLRVQWAGLGGRLRGCAYVEVGILSARTEEALSVPSEAVDVRVDKWSTPVLNDENRLKLATFATNMRGSVTLANVEGKVLGTWEESLRLAQHADRIGFDAVIPVARWRGFGGDANLSNRSFEPFTWATALLARTQRIQAFATVHVPVFHPTLAAKMAATADHVSGGPVRGQCRGWVVPRGVRDVRDHPEGARGPLRLRR